MNWIELSVYTTDIGTELVCGALAGAGVEQVSIEESAERVACFLQDAAPYWDFADAAALAGKHGPCVRAYIADVPEQHALLEAAKAAVLRIADYYPFEEIAPLRIQEARMAEEDWANNWKQYYKPMPVGERLLVCPSWEREGVTEQQLQGRELLLLDPGMAFGTGGHHTTRLCLHALEACALSGARVLDIGCGSGILSIAALLLGAGHACCVDIDPVATKVVGRNMQLNGIEQARYAVHTGDILQDHALQDMLRGQYDVVVANIIADVVIALCPLVPALMKPGGLFLCSGIIDEREQDVLGALEANGFTVLHCGRAGESSGGVQETEWLAFLARH